MTALEKATVFVEKTFKAKMRGPWVEVRPNLWSADLWAGDRLMQKIEWDKETNRITLFKNCGHLELEETPDVMDPKGFSDVRDKVEALNVYANWRDDMQRIQFGIESPTNSVGSTIGLPEFRNIINYLVTVYQEAMKASKDATSQQ